MANKQQKAAQLAEIRETMGKAKSCVLADFRGMTVKEATELRNEFRKVGVEFKVCKNTLTRIVANELGIQGLDPYLEGPTAIAFGIEDPVAPAKVLTEFAKTTKNKNFAIKAGVVEGKVITVDGVKALADLPSREVLLAQVLAGIQGPLVGLVNVLQGPIRKLGYALEDLRKQKESA
ncbi:50S ribosomal protein l10 [Heliomicrobium modesticaldum Ice1]|uniref:Large ribosomal subunit protein uL10 n=1 Tax=Heliobacterium modesticaldum (strain ATCC 51547 / Ice1) TaxID=498761 RepID=B0TC45_HELMI|nr:50S ribosomal protein L10 [Heliomicrobium modesticaldum]ABZ83944.1 50S ribosomal protein l10 [Heliomicrobium modesticaldum Ice1]